MLLPWIVYIAHKMCSLRRIIGGQLSNAKCAVGGNLKIWGTAHHSEEPDRRLLFTLEQHPFWGSLSST